MMQNNPLAIPNTYLSHLMIFVDEQAYTDIEHRKGITIHRTLFQGDR
ncbi:hypothetical protein IH992_19940 [Candidatus Poribacteria bacterium]|nr:hypothetical protein [Candidatus Poribacteria bacterium]